MKRQHHTLKIRAVYAIAKYNKDKMFEIRLNDRNYAIGDTVSYVVVDRENMGEPALTKFENSTYLITFVTDYEQQNGYVVFGDYLLE